MSGAKRKRRVDARPAVWVVVRTYWWNPEAAHASVEGVYTTSAAAQRAKTEAEIQDEANKNGTNEYEIFEERLSGGPAPDGTSAT